ncbi:MAG: hypothetical protein IJS05_06935 [Paludibacteraceae bacterium]|nr:hypothetical protein [Paludibacteraceae bacterium]
MKKNVVFFIASLPIIMSSCESEINNKPYDVSPECTMTIVKFLSSDYYNYVIAEIVDDSSPSVELTNGEKAYKIRGEGRACQDFYIGSSPYIDVYDGYYVVDWKWGDFLYPSSNVLLPVRWSEVSDRQQIWDNNLEVLTSTIFSRQGCIKLDRRAIDEYLNIKPNMTMSTNGIDSVCMDYLATPIIYNSCDEDYSAEIIRQDSIHKVYIDRIKQIIKSGDIDKVLQLH